MHTHSLYKYFWAPVLTRIIIIYCHIIFYTNRTIRKPNKIRSWWWLKLGLSCCIYSSFFSLSLDSFCAGSFHWELLSTIKMWCLWILDSWFFCLYWWHRRLPVVKNQFSRFLIFLLLWIACGAISPVRNLHVHNVFAPHFLFSLAAHQNDACYASATMQFGVVVGSIDSKIAKFFSLCPSSYELSLIFS